jgi:hypothetical protein
VPDTPETPAPGAAQTFDPRLVYAKTPTGSVEMGERKLGLSPVVRRILIVIDGQRRLADLPAFARPGDLGFIIEELQARGLIALVGIADDPSESERIAHAVEDLRILVAMKNLLRGVFEAELGSAGQVLEARIADSVSLDVLKRVLREGIDAVAHRRGDTAARRIVSLVRPLLNQTLRGAG